ncbi:GNAT family N-acetyltransferase [Aeoliella sp. ICT_H6.2]|uniref:GNAT family N-acetyltransferase n=1 Tax=Aeoliella straminimaris TaxID=2954799 RepID=A0A9X2JHB6_9BACT|nr:GNAT family N-acetyltransferase [Aeoliella straminimaris]MCO6045626.1 GNAT family N-acetyltransferase [Aeoliella straminimaris]
MVTLQELTSDNWVECSDLELHDHQQGYVASNVYTIAESKFKPHYRLRAIYADGTMVGLVAFCHENDPEDLELYWVFRLMIDKHYQGQGIGTAAMRLAIDEIAALGARRIRTMHKPTNTVAASLYANLGFQDIGFDDDGDVLLEMHV